MLAGVTARMPMALVAAAASLGGAVSGGGTCAAAAAAADAGAVTRRIAVDDFQARTFDDGAGHTLPYRLYVPAGGDPAVKHPLVLFLHGAGGRGTDNRLQL